MQLSTPLNFRTLLAGLGLTLAVVSAQAQDATPAPVAAPAPVATSAPVLPTSRYPQASFGLGLGYGAPYGWGLDFSFMVQPKLDVSAGLGFTITGGKIGVGTRYYFTPERKVSAFVGGNLVYSTGIDHVTINTNGQSYSGSVYYSNMNDDVVVNFKSTSLLHLRGGMRWQPLYRFALIGAVGYGVVLGGDPVEYVSGNYSQSDRNLVNLFSPGGIELSVGVAFAMGRRN